VAPRFWYSCLDCKRYIELGREYPVLANHSVPNLLNIGDITNFKTWVETWDKRFHSGVDMTFVEDVLGWFIKHWGHRIHLSCDASENEPWKRYVEGWYVGDKEGWKEEVRAEPPHARYKNHVRQWM